MTVNGDEAPSSQWRHSSRTWCPAVFDFRCHSFAPQGSVLGRNKRMDGGGEARGGTGTGPVVKASTTTTMGTGDEGWGACWTSVWDAGRLRGHPGSRTETWACPTPWRLEKETVGEWNTAWVQPDGEAGVTVLRLVCRNHVEEQERWRTGAVEITGTTTVGKHTGK